MLKISIITPAYNSAEYISKCIESVAASNYDLNYVEHIIVDDGSTDCTAEICTKYAAKYPHIKFVSKTNGNWGSVINYVKHNKLVTGDYTIILDSDDQVLPNAFSLINRKNEGADIILGDYWDFNGIKKTCRVPSLLFVFKKKFIKRMPTDYLHHACIPCCTYFKTELLYKTSDLLEGLIYQDCVLYAELQLLSKKIKHIKHAIGLYWNVRPGNTVTSNKTERAIKSSLSNIKYYCQNNLFDLFATHMVFDPAKISKELSKSNINLVFRDKKLKLKAYPWWQRIYIKIIFSKIKKNLMF